MDATDENGHVTDEMPTEDWGGNTMNETDENGYVTSERLKDGEGGGDGVGRRGRGGGHHE